MSRMDYDIQLYLMKRIRGLVKFYDDPINNERFEVEIIKQDYDDNDYCFELEIGKFTYKEDIQNFIESGIINHCNVYRSDFGSVENIPDFINKFEEGLKMLLPEIRKMIYLNDKMAIIRGYEQHKLNGEDYEYIEERLQNDIGVFRAAILYSTSNFNTIYKYADKITLSMI